MPGYKQVLWTGPCQSLHHLLDERFSSLLPYRYSPPDALLLCDKNAEVYIAGVLLLNFISIQQAVQRVV